MASVLCCKRLMTIVDVSLWLAVLPSCVYLANIYVIFLILNVV